MGGKYVLTTLGCKVNQYESQQIRETLESLGLRPALAHETPDVAVVNTCAVTASASAKSRQAIRRIAHNGHTAVLVVGCGAAADAKHIRQIAGVGAILDHSVDACAELKAVLSRNPPNNPPFTPNHIVSRSLPVVKGEEPRNGEFRMANSENGSPSRHLPFAVRKAAIVPLPGRVERLAGHQRAFLKVQDGCDALCTYCIVPQLRSKLRSKPIGAAVAEARGLVRAGHKEIVVTGVFLGAYGRETALRRRQRSPRPPLADLVDALAHIQGLERLRLSSLEPGDVDEALLEALVSHDNCVPHLHLPLQSGSARILKRMNRQYTLDAFIAMIDRVRSMLDRPAITTDIIVGFPGETENDFQATLDLADFAQFAKIHAFPFSPREGTAAARWRQQFVQPSRVRERMKRLAEVERATSVAYRRCLVGETERVLVENTECGSRIALAESGRSGDDGPQPSSDDPQSAVSSQPFRLRRISRGAVHNPQSEIHNPKYAVVRGRADRYFEVHFEADDVRPGDLVPVRIDRVTPTRTHGTRLPARPGAGLPFQGNACPDDGPGHSE